MAWVPYNSLVVALQIMFESLPVSSSGHTVLFICFLYSRGILSTVENVLRSPLMTVAHIPTILMVAWFYRSRIIFFWQRPRTGSPFLMKALLFGFFVHASAAVCIMFVTKILWYEQLMVTPPLWSAFLITMFVLLVTRWLPQDQYRSRLTLRDASILGVSEAFAYSYPGVSRFAVTYLTARALRFHPRIAHLTSWALLVQLVLTRCFYDFGVQSGFSLLPPIELYDWIILSGATGIGWAFFYWSALWAYRGCWWRYALYMPIPVLLSLLMKC